MSKIILVSGKKRSGKDHTVGLLSECLTNLGHSVDVQAFADPMKVIISTIFGITLAELDEYKNNPDTFSVNVTDKYDGTVYHSTDFRTIIQMFGNNAMKPIFGESVWVDLFKKYVANSTADFILVPDFRFPVEYINHSLTVRVDCNLTDQSDTHASEVSLDDYTFHYRLNNDNHSLTLDSIQNLAERIIADTVGYNNKQLMKRENNA